ncbi:COP9 signalosome complex subunit 7a-like [Scyliorhinus canicula]|uniref:COP9 signalosome complex subunit 7a-like n=1 Tax=Scyliorhinus canicula TaxID=7830 RepID=UPI0018F74564|nr:COP9 signalosome complex subunit 7a-like [Scyliorhinus canicula]
MASEVKASGQSLEQFLLLAKTVRGAALVALINQLLEVPGVYVFGEFLEIPNIQELMTGPYAPSYQLLSLFAYGTFSDYMANAANLPALTAAQKNKMRHLSIVSMAARVKSIPYSVLLLELELKNLRELEDLIIEAIYADVVQGKLDQRNQLLEVDYSIGRDIRPQDISSMARTLQEWCSSCEAVLIGIEDQIGRADQYKEHQLKVKQQMDSEVLNLKKTLKATGGSVHESEQHVMETREPAAPPGQRQSAKKASKVKGVRGSGKIWSKSN